MLNLCWSLFEENVPYHISLLCRRVLSENNWLPALGWGHYGSTARDMISSSVTNNIKPSQFVSTEEKSCHLFSCLKRIFPSVNSYYIRHINYYSNKFNKNREISSILNDNQHNKSLSVIIKILSQSKQWQILDKHIYNNYWQLDEPFLI